VSPLPRQLRCMRCRRPQTAPLPFGLFPTHAGSGAIATNPPAANNHHAPNRSRRGDQDKVLQLAQAAKEQAPEDPRISDTLGWLLLQAGRPSPRPRLLKDSAAKLPNNPQVQYHLGMAYHQAGEKDNARKASSTRGCLPGGLCGQG
jgi:predicted Zn-dependent protease